MKDPKPCRPTVQKLLPAGVVEDHQACAGACPFIRGKHVYCSASQFSGFGCRVWGRGAGEGIHLGPIWGYLGPYRGYLAGLG